MGIIDTVTEAFAASTKRTPGNAGDDGSEGSYWCDDCGVRVRDVAVDDEGLDLDGEGLDLDGEGTPRCPDCGGPMRVERASGTGCAC